VTFGEPQAVVRREVYEPIESRSAGAETTTEDTMELKELTLAQLQAGRPDIIEAIANAAKAEVARTEGEKALKEQLAAANEKNAALTTENAALKTKVDEADVREAKRARNDLIETKLAAAKLPEAAVTPLFRESLELAKDEAAVDALIAERKTVVESVAKPPAPGNGTRPIQPASARVDEALAPGKKAEVTEADIGAASKTLFA